MNLLALPPARLRRLFNLWWPFLFAGIRVLDLPQDWSSARVRLRRYWFNRNYVGTHFGGSLFAMTDPFWMLLLIHRLGTDYIVWDQAATIEFLKATREDVYADFVLDETVVDEIRAAAADGQKHLRWFDVEIKTAGGELIARSRKQIYVRLKPDRRPVIDPIATPATPAHQTGSHRA